MPSTDIIGRSIILLILIVGAKGAIGLWARSAWVPTHRGPTDTTTHARGIMGNNEEVCLGR
ncbi:MAG: hypothetical protein ABI380_12355 [Edaphobacter sp.]